MNRGRIPLAELASLPSFYFPTPAWDRKRIAFYWDKTGQMELYLRWLEKHEMEKGEESPLGLILCAEGSKETGAY